MSTTPSASHAGMCFEIGMANPERGVDVTSWKKERAEIMNVAERYILWEWKLAGNTSGLDMETGGL